MNTITLKQLLADNNPFGISKITIPRIQRSYAQGRNDIHALKTRERFLKHIREKIAADQELTLDFIYGNVDGSTLIPLDGQQRLTTLWLLHWYAAVRCPENPDRSFLSRFTYHTRYSARDFIIRLAAYVPSFSPGRSLSDEIRNRGWFPFEWENDPTVRSMLTMLDAIHTHFGDIDDLWFRLDKINFYFKDIADMKLTDEIYIKMNSRGKPLTNFEHLKAEILKTIRNNEFLSEEQRNETGSRIGRKFDIDWTDLLWDYRGVDNSIDDKFIHYMLLVFHLLIYRSNRSVSEFASFDFFNLVNYFFGGHDAGENLAFFENAFDCWVRVRKRMPIGEFFKSFLSENHQEGKSVPLERMSIDLFGACIDNYPFERQGLNSRQWLTTLFAFMTYLFTHNPEEMVNNRDFRRRIRIVLNLQKNSINEVVDNPKGDAGNRMPAILRQVDSIVNQGVIAEEIWIDNVLRHNFSVSQLKEEREKLVFTVQYPELAPKLFAFEDHHLIMGRIAILGTDNHGLFNRFMHLFDNNDLNLIDRALLALGDYWQQSRRIRWSLQLGSGNNESSIGRKAWFDLFHPTDFTLNFDNTRAAVKALLTRSAEIDNAMLERIAGEYLQHCENRNIYPWKYYYIKYDVFRICRYGKYYQMPEQKYQLLALWTEKKPSQNAYDCFLKATGGEIEDSWKLVLSDDRYLRNEETAFVVYDADDTEISRLVIPQNENGIDTVNRIDYLIGSGLL